MLLSPQAQNKEMALKTVQKKFPKIRNRGPYLRYGLEVTFGKGLWRPHWDSSRLAYVLHCARALVGRDNGVEGVRVFDSQGKCLILELLK